MNDLAFVLWVIGWPLSLSISEYLGAKTRLAFNKEPYSEKTEITAAVIYVVIWVLIGISLR